MFLTHPQVPNAGKGRHHARRVITESLSFPTASTSTGPRAAAAAVPALSLIWPAAAPLTEVLRRAARDLLVAAVEAEAAQYLADRAALLDVHGHRQVVRNGHAAPCTSCHRCGPALRPDVAGS